MALGSDTRKSVLQQRCARRAVLVAGLSLCLLPGVARADSASVPYPMQAQLLAKVASYDRRFRERAGSKAVVLLVSKRGNPESMQAAQQLKTALGAIDTVGDLPHQEDLVQFDDAEGLAKLARDRKAAIVYLGPGLDGEIAAIRRAFASTRIMTVAANPDNVSGGLVLGFALVSGKPKLVVNLNVALAQGVDFRADVLRLMKVVG